MGLVETLEVIDMNCDKRQSWKVKHSVAEVLCLVICATIADCDNIIDIVEYGNDEIDFLRRFFPYSHGIPSKNTIYRVLELVDKKYTEKIMDDLIAEMKETLDNHISIDGKYMRGNRKRENHFSDMVVTAYENGICLANETVKVIEKSNEIPAVYRILNNLNLEGKLVTMDSIHTQMENTKTIIDKGGNWLLPLKGNQPDSFGVVESAFNVLDPACSLEQKEIVRDRLETRKFYVLDNLEWIHKNYKLMNKWKGLKAVIKREKIVVENGVKSEETRYFMASFISEASDYASIIKDHWKVETMHWLGKHNGLEDAVYQKRPKLLIASENPFVMRTKGDIVFKEDDSNIKNLEECVNLNLIKKYALSKIKRYKESDSSLSKVSVSNIRKKAARKTEVLLKILEA